eukprot:TRINITY_DN909_c0_g1_i1.p1 TRINITY_DN909_c0_g1~~TRINITY_DN909_c0_g1_i1.p1  ORF type:complete len:208 (-),score=58.45 TRINITY_DN909_c0_g1_i1:91-714(-)
MKQVVILALFFAVANSQIFGNITTNPPTPGFLVTPISGTTGGFKAIPTACLAGTYNTVVGDNITVWACDTLQCNGTCEAEPYAQGQGTFFRATLTIPDGNLVKKFFSGNACKGEPKAIEWYSPRCNQDDVTGTFSTFTCIGLDVIQTACSENTCKTGCQSTRIPDGTCTILDTDSTMSSCEGAQPLPGSASVNFVSAAAIVGAVLLQ